MFKNHVCIFIIFIFSSLMYSQVGVGLGYNLNSKGISLMIHGKLPDYNNTHYYLHGKYNMSLHKEVDYEDIDYNNVSYWSNNYKNAGSFTLGLSQYFYDAFAVNGGIGISIITEKYNFKNTDPLMRRHYYSTGDEMYSVFTYELGTTIKLHKMLEVYINYSDYAGSKYNPLNNDLSIGFMLNY